MAVALLDLPFTIDGGGDRLGLDHTRVESEPHRTPHVSDGALLEHQVNHRVR